MTTSGGGASPKRCNAYQIAIKVAHPPPPRLYAPGSWILIHGTLPWTPKVVPWGLDVPQLRSIPETI